MRQPSASQTWLATLLVTAVFSFGAGFSLHWALANGSDNRETNEQVASTRSDRNPRPPQEVGDIWPARHVMIAVDGQWLSNEARDLIRELRPGGVVLRPENIRSAGQVLQLVRDMKEAAGIGQQRFSDLPLVILEDPENAARTLRGGEAIYTAAMAYPNASAASASARRLAQLCADIGVSVVLGPSLTDQPAIQQSANERNQVAARGIAYAQSLTEAGILPVVKQFPRNFAEFRGRQDMNRLAESMLPFNEAVSQGIPGVLVGHAPVPELDKDDPSRPASMSPVLVTSVLRERWGFRGVVIADDVSARGGLRRAPDLSAIDALAAGCDTLLFLDPSAKEIRAVAEAITAAVESGELSKANLDAAKDRLDAWQSWLERPTASPRPSQVARRPEASRRNEIDASVSPRNLPARQLDPVPSPKQHTQVATRQPEPARDQAPRSDEDEWVQPVQTAPAIPETLIQKEATPKPQPNPNTETQAPTTNAASKESSPEISPEKSPEASVSVEVNANTNMDSENAQDMGDIKPSPEDTDAMLAPVETEIREKVASTTPTLPAETDTTEPLPERDTDSDAQEEPSSSDAPPQVHPEESTSPDTEESVEETLPDKEEDTTGLPRFEHTVTAGETLSEIAAAYNVSMEDIMGWNEMDSNQVNLGATLAIYSNGAVPEVEEDDSFKHYEIESGDTLTRIARENGITRAELMTLNGIEDPNKIFIGQKLRLPR